MWIHVPCIGVLRANETVFEPPVLGEPHVRSALSNIVFWTGIDRWLKLWVLWKKLIETLGEYLLWFGLDLLVALVVRAVLVRVRHVGRDRQSIEADQKYPGPHGQQEKGYLRSDV